MSVRLGAFGSSDPDFLTFLKQYGVEDVIGSNIILEWRCAMARGQENSWRDERPGTFGKDAAGPLHNECPAVAEHLDSVVQRIRHEDRPRPADLIALGHAEDARRSPLDELAEVRHRRRPREGVRSDGCDGIAHLLHTVRA